MSEPEAASSLAEERVMRVAELPSGALEALVAVWGLTIERVADGAPIPSTHFGAPEAGIRGSTVFVRGDTPVHSALHEAFHLVCAGGERRLHIDGDAGDGDFVEEVAVCYLQLAVADRLPGFGFERAVADMDAWGYTFRLGSARRWFAEDAEDAVAWLRRRGLLDRELQPVPKIT